LRIWVASLVPLLSQNAGTIIALVGRSVGCSLPVQQEIAREDLYPSAVFIFAGRNRIECARVEFLINKSAAAIASTIAMPTAAAKIKEVYLPWPGVN
jgi:hypothetical protein